MKKRIDFTHSTLEELAAAASETLKAYEIDAVLVGGGCVSIYSQNRYQSYDLDYVTYEDMKKVETALKSLGFKKDGRRFVHPETQFFIEFVSPPVAAGSEPIHEFEEHQTPLGTIKMLTPTDSVKDRLASFYHWGDLQSLEQAIAICTTVPKRVDLDEIKRWSKKEGHEKKLEHFMHSLEQT